MKLFGKKCIIYNRSIKTCACLSNQRVEKLDMTEGMVDCIQLSDDGSIFFGATHKSNLGKYHRSKIAFTSCTEALAFAKTRHLRRIRKEVKAIETTLNTLGLHGAMIPRSDDEILRFFIS